MALKLFLWYENKLIQKPLITKSCTAFCTAILGDILSQYIEKRAHHLGFSANYQIERSFKMGLYGFFFSAPLYHNWLGYLYKAIPGRSLLAVAKKVLVDQLFFSWIAMSSYFIFVTLLMGGSFSQGITKIKNGIVEVWLTGIKVWPFVAIISFGFLPLHFQVTFGCITAMFWSTYMSYQVNYKHKHFDLE
ncbi:unnamed protein product [Blepharisma stoltei]|uniref:Uncharacterized protein n=1 Tax=Blepharisma stoltei TaxID=1481888 RepID=A0AAU9IGA3_9CILI|nr:unnamed protein product [Blepharisma stoltei]